MKASMKALLTAILLASLISMAPAQENAFRQAISRYKAESGGNLASAPKIRPDGKFYFLHGKIQIPDEDAAGFMANLSPSEENELLANALRRSRGMGESADYFGVSLPAGLEDYYFDNAKVGGGFDVIGRYVANMKYSTVDGREMQAPVFEAVYFDLWSARQSVLAAPAAAPAPSQSEEDILSSKYAECTEMAITPDEIFQCISDEAQRQDARLNAAYKVAMSTVADKNALRAKQRQWIKERDKKCAPDEENYGRTADSMSAHCIAVKTASRADELETMK
jgi:uncharacterized protein YecT (DUF1311 family)